MLTRLTNSLTDNGGRTDNSNRPTNSARGDAGFSWNLTVPSNEKKWWGGLLRGYSLLTVKMGDLARGMAPY